jgi:hypothetical protein
MASDKEVLRLKLEKVRLLEEQAKLKYGLPFLYGQKLYKWQEDYKNNRHNRVRLLCAANQIGKSTIQIKDRVDIATNPAEWRRLWPHLFRGGAEPKPSSWYLYPNQGTSKAEFDEKWVPSILPKGEFKDHPIYGWKETVVNKILVKIDFNSGWTIYFKTYSQSVQDLQSGTVWAIDCDEELPVEIYDELTARLFATDGYFSMAFTATIGQTFWKNAIEGRGDKETFKDAFKTQISQYDCLKYADGSDTPWTIERIKRNESKCKNVAEIKKRIFGKFVVDTGLLYSGFNESVNMVDYPKLEDGRVFKGVPNGWSIYSGIDYGSGGENNHPSAIAFLSVSPDFKKIRLFKCRRFDKIQMTAGDLYAAYVKERGDLKPIIQAFDWSSADLGTIASRNGDTFTKADKNHASGELALNSALKSGIFKIYKSEESDKLADELLSIKEGYDKRRAADDLIDAVRYAINSVPIDWAALMGESLSEKVKDVNPDQNERDARPRDYMRENIKELADGCEEEFEFWAELY